MNNSLRFTIAACTLSLGLLTAPAPGQDAPAAKVRFDHLVRNDFFAGFSGDREAMARAMKVAEETLKENPKQAEALVWHGAALFSMSGRAFQAGEMEKGQEMWTKGLAEMDEAVALRPDTPATRIPRGAAMLTASRFVPEERKAALLERGLSDYAHMYAVQKDALATMATHPKGELLMGLADAYDRTGDQEKSKAMLTKVVEEMAGTVYSQRAQKWLDTGSLPVMQRNCIGCHTAGH